MNTPTDRFFKQQSLVPAEKLEQLPVTIIGVGAIGRQVSIQMASLGVRHLQLIDFDVVEETNITSQSYLAADVGRYKVEATQQYLKQLDPKIMITAIHDRFRPTQQINPIVFCCVDSISTRSIIWKHLQYSAEFYCDGRMLGETMRILTACDLSSREYYSKTLFPQSEAQQGSCTAHTTIYTANIAAGLMVHQYVRWLREGETVKDSLFNLNSSELILND